MPVCVCGATTEWGGHGKWTIESFVERFGDFQWRFSDTHGAMMELNTYYEYINNQEDDSPLGIYDSLFGHDEPTNELLDEYSVPPFFSHDLFELYPHARPPFRWILIGPARSGTGMHIDPLYTNAWVTLMSGLKRWVMFPPSTDPERVGMIKGKPQLESVKWFMDYYRDTVLNPDWPVDWKPVEILQREGETVFVPQGWLHVVLNLEPSLAVTHNYAPEFGQLEKIWSTTAVEEPTFALRWYREMRIHRPDLASRIRVWHESDEGQCEMRKGSDDNEGVFSLPSWDDTEPADISDDEEGFCDAEIDGYDALLAKTSSFTKISNECM